MASALAAVVQLLDPLRPLTTVVEVAAVFKAAEADRKVVQEKVNVEMEAFFRNDPNHPPDLRVVAESCLVVDVLGADYKMHIIERYIQLQLAEYRRIFRSTDEAGQLDNVPRRYAWFRRVLKHHDEEHAALFPASWEVTRLLVAGFAEQTRVDLANVLGKQVPQVGVLLDALQATLDFEGVLARRFNKPVSGATRGDCGRWLTFAPVRGHHDRRAQLARRTNDKVDHLVHLRLALWHLCRRAGPRHRRHAQPVPRGQEPHVHGRHAQRDGCGRCDHPA